MKYYLLKKAKEIPTKPREIIPKIGEVDDFCGGVMETRVDGCPSSGTTGVGTALGEVSGAIILNNVLSEAFSPSAKTQYSSPTNNSSSRPSTTRERVISMRGVENVLFSPVPFRIAILYSRCHLGGGFFMLPNTVL